MGEATWPATLQPGLRNVLNGHATKGIALLARIRYTMLYFKDLIESEAAQVRFHSTPMYNSIFRFDDEMVVTPHRFSTPGFTAPLLHLRRMVPYGVFESFAEHFEAIWQTTVPVPKDPSP